jgi:hypothetical protein
MDFPDMGGMDFSNMGGGNNSVRHYPAGFLHGVFCV